MGSTSVSRHQLNANAAACKDFNSSRQGVTPPALGESCDVFLKNCVPEESLLECLQKSSEKMIWGAIRDPKSMPKSMSEKY